MSKTVTTSQANGSGIAPNPTDALVYKNDEEQYEYRADMAKHGGDTEQPRNVVIDMMVVVVVLVILVFSTVKAMPNRLNNQ